MSDNDDQLKSAQDTVQPFKFLPKSNLLSEAQSRALLAKHGVENDRIVCFNDIVCGITYEDVQDIVPYDQYYTAETSEYILDCVDVIKAELLREMRYNNITVLSDGYFTVEGFEDPMMDAFNTESSPMSSAYVRLSDMLYLAYKTLRHPKTQKQFQKEIYETIFMLSVDADDRADWYENGRLKPVVRAKKMSFVLSKNWAERRAKKIAEEKAQSKVIPDRLETVADTTVTNTTVIDKSVFAKRLAARKARKENPEI